MEVVKALDIIDEVIALIRGSATTEEAKEGLISNGLFERRLKPF